MKKLSKSRSFYFASKPIKSHYYSCDDDYQFFLRHGDEYLEKRPSGSNAEDFDSRPLHSPLTQQHDPDHKEDELLTPALPEETLRNKYQPQQPLLANHGYFIEDSQLIGTRLIERKVPCKVEPKVIFAAERTFFTWIRSALFLFGASLTVLKHSKNEPIKIIYGCSLLPISLAFIVYPLIRCKFFLFHDLLFDSHHVVIFDTANVMIFLL